MELKECKIVNTSSAGETEYLVFQRIDDLKIILFNEVVNVIQNGINRPFDMNDDVLYIRKHMNQRCFMAEVDNELTIYLN